MLVIEVQLLAGRYAATAHNDRNRVEWPPHPARLYSAMVAVLHDGGPQVDAAERTALLAVERAGSPAIEASNVDLEDVVGRRTVHEVYVPVNDTAVVHTNKLNEASNALAAASNEGERKKAENRWAKALAAAIAVDPRPAQSAIKDARALLPEGRGRQKRTFPSMAPERDVVRFLWANLDLDDEQRRALAALLDRVTRLGHSSSLVRCAVADVAQPSLVPAADNEPADWTLRVVGEGQLDRLETAFKRHQSVEPRVLPSRPQRYRIAGEQAGVAAPQEAVLDHEGWIVLAAEDDARVQAMRCVDVAKALHRSLVSFVPQPPPEFISGRRPDARPSERPHLAIVPLPDVGHEYAHGGLLGVALILPRSVQPDEKSLLLQAVARFENQAGSDEDPPVLTLRLRGGAAMRVRRTETPELRGLRARTWCGPARRWVTATPIALDRNPGNLRSRTTGVAAAEQAKAIIADACERIGVPRPTAVEVSLAPLLAGSVPVRAFDPFPREPGRLRRVRVHAEIIFDEPVRGPLILGAGRYVGLGLCRPVERGKANGAVERW